MDEHRPSTVTPHPDRARPGEAPWALQLVVRVERADPPTHSAVCELAASATVRFLADERAQAGGVWAPAVQRWIAGRIRKHVRRARGAAWQRVQELDGVTVVGGGAELRVFVPCATDAVPVDIARLQLEGLDLSDPQRRARAEAVPGAALVVSICPEPSLPTGKAAAAAAHAAQLAAMRMPADRLAVWSAGGFPVVVEHPDPAGWAERRRTAPVEIVDAGFTVVAPNTTTAVARWA